MERISDIPNRSIEAYASSHVEIPKKKTEEVEREHVSPLSREDLELLRQVAKEMRKNGLDVDLKELAEVMEDPQWKEVIERMSGSAIPLEPDVTIPVEPDVTRPVKPEPREMDPLFEAMYLTMSMQTSFTKLAIALADFMRTKTQKINAYINVLTQLRPLTVNDIIWVPKNPAWTEAQKQEVVNRLQERIRFMQETVRAYRSEAEEEAKLVQTGMQSLEQGSRKQADVFNALLNLLSSTLRATFK